ncbi:hypothetical protein NHX12_012453 [Muraenolepis orangiensis]|uniref:Minor histocompatibility antigen H13 n=1 Tax=Muraenolepis orangiensis TaxID=630683 RepID=A0A9Q0DG60_9TELE|nr:hypothetical protein NHX12_012453 [Muraenolepis orangiensis]
MAEVLPTEASVAEALNGSAEPDVMNATAAKFVATPEGTALAYGSLLFMALLPIFLGALRSVSCSKSKVPKIPRYPGPGTPGTGDPGTLGPGTRGGCASGYRNASDMPETITSRDAARFPIIASCTLFGLYLFFKVFSQEYINLLLSVYFFVLGILALSHTLSPLMARVFPASIPIKQYQLLFTQGSGEAKEEIVNYEFDTKDLVCLVIGAVVGVWYILKKHWVANNLFGLAFALNGVELLHLNNVSTGCILLGGLFVYDVFWVFGTNVMVTVARSFEAPIKLVFPQDLLERGMDASNFAMLGLGDIVIPGIFIALLLLKKNSRTYFYSSFLPALLYLVPACIGFPVIVAMCKGELTEMFR